MKFDTIKWSLTTGVNEGYSLEDQQLPPIEKIGAIWQRVAEQVMADTGTYVSATICESRTLYSPQWGCPQGGEYSYTLSGSCNPAFAEVDSYLQALQQCAAKLKEELRQSTLLIEVTPAALTYLQA